MKYRKKPIVIEAIQIHGNVSEIENFVGNVASVDVSIEDSAWQVGKGTPHTIVVVHTLEGDMYATDGDYIIKGVKGEFYPCRQDIFDETYEMV